MASETHEKHARLLRAIPLFADLSPDELEKIESLAQVRSYPARTPVVNQGEPARALFGIMHGRLKVVSSGPDGRDTVLGIMAEGEVFGEVALLDGGARSATCTTIEPCELMVLDREPFMDLLATSPAIAVKLLTVLAKRLRRLSQRSEDNAFLDVPTRLARALLDLVARFGERLTQPNRGVYISLKLSQQELGDLVSATRESVNKHLSDWSKQQILNARDGRLIITNLEELRRLARVDDD